MLAFLGFQIGCNLQL